MQTQCNPVVDLSSILQARKSDPPGDRIKPALAAIGLDVSRLAVVLGVSRTHTSLAINRYSGSERLRRRIVDHLDRASTTPVTYTDIWPAEWSAGIPEALY